MPRTLVLATCVSLLLTKAALYAQQQSPGAAEFAKLPRAAAHTFATPEQEYHALKRERRPLEFYIQPPKGTSREAVEKVFGTQSRYSKGGKWKPFSAYLLGKSGLELRVYYNGDKVESSQLEESPGGATKVQNTAPGPSISVEKMLPWYRKEISQLKAVVEEFDEKLTAAPWNRR